MLAMGITMPPRPANKIEDILEVLTPGQLVALTEQLRRIKSIGYGRVTIVFQNGVSCQIQVQESFDFRDSACDVE